MNQEIYESERVDLLRWRRFCVRFGRNDIMSPEEIDQRAALLASEGATNHFTQLIEEGKRATRPGFLKCVTDMNQTKQTNDSEKLRKLFERL
jgi:hypothetical protein